MKLYEQYEKILILFGFSMYMIYSHYHDLSKVKAMFSGRISNHSFSKFWDGITCPFNLSISKLQRCIRWNLEMDN